MNNAIEATKREMYGCLEQIKATATHGFTPNYSIRMFEPALEEHLEELRKELKCAHEDADGANLLRTEFQGRLERMTEERDRIQGRLHAVDEAYDKSQRALGVAGDEIRILQALLKLRGDEGSASTQDSRENASYAFVEASALMIVLGALVDSQRIITDWLIPDGIKAKKAMKMLLPVLDNEDLCTAQKVFERENRCPFCLDTLAKDDCFGCGE